MQWLIDIAIEAMEQYLADNPRFVDRGYASSRDFELADFIRDENFHELDLSAIIPATAKGIYIALAMSADTAGKRGTFSPSGNAFDYNYERRMTQVAAQMIHTGLTLPIRTPQKIWYRFDIANWSIINFTTLGWWL